jgi:hypothetical protein
MKNSRPYTFLSLRFRRWSRNAWAVFSSVGREVTVGTLHNSVADQSMVKTQVPAGATVYESPSQFREEPEETEEVQLQVIELLPVILAVPAGAASFRFSATRIYNGWYAFSGTSRFFMPNLPLQILRNYDVF